MLTIAAPSLPSARENAIYRFDPVEGTKEELVSFHCRPRRAARDEATTFTTQPTELGVKRLVEYQVSGDTEAHGIPLR